MLFDHVVERNPVQQADLNIAESAQGRVQLVNAWLDSHHHISPPAQAPRPEEPPRDRLVDIITNAAQKSFDQKDDWALRDIFYGDLHTAWNKGEPVADKINKRLEDAHSEYRVRFEGPFKTPTTPPYGANIYEYRLTVMDQSGKDLSQFPMEFVKDE
jgi:hypothetical protein